MNTNLSYSKVSYDEDNRSITIIGEIDLETTSGVLSSLLHFERIDKEGLEIFIKESVESKTWATKEYYKRLKPIKVYIHSDGGYVRDGLAIADLISRYPSRVNTYCLGTADSTAFIIFLAGYERFISEHAVVLYHSVSNEFKKDNVQYLTERLERTKDCQEIMEKYVLSRTAIDQEMLDEVREKKIDKYFDAAAALKYGIATEMWK